MLIHNFDVSAMVVKNSLWGFVFLYVSHFFNYFRKPALNFIFFAGDILLLFIWCLLTAVKIIVKIDRL